MARPRKPGRKDFPPNLYQNAAGYFFWRNPSNGQVKGLGRERPKAMRDARSMNATLAEIRSPNLSNWVKGAESDMTLAEFTGRYFDWWKAKEPRKQASLDNLDSKLKQIRKAPFVNSLLRMVMPLQVSQWLEAYHERAPSQANIIRGVLEDLFTLAISYGHVAPGTNPVTISLALPEVTRQRLEWSDFCLIRDRAMAHGDRALARAMVLGLVTGQRIGVLTKLRFVDEHDGYLWVVQNKATAGLPETHLKLPLRFSLEKLGLSIEGAIKECRASLVASKHILHRDYANSNLGKKGVGLPLAQNTLQEKFSEHRNALIEAGKIVVREGNTPPTFHEIRSLTERMIEEEYTPKIGADEARKLAQQILGHKNVETTELYNDPRQVVWQEVTVAF